MPHEKSDKVKVKVKRSREVKPFNELASANYVILDNAKQNRAGCFYEYLTSIMLSAFSFEAYLNQIGSKLFDYWDQMERLPWRNKMTIITAHLKLGIDQKRRPFKTISSLFKFRNMIAHCKPELLNTETIEEGNMEEIRRKKPLTEWENLCSLEFAQQAYDDVGKLVKMIHDKAGFSIDDLYNRVYGYEINRNTSSPP